LGLALRRLARRFLSRGPAAAARAGIRILTAVQHRNQRLVLFPAAAGIFRGVVSRDAAELCLRREGRAVYHPCAPFARRGDAAGELLRFRRFQPARKARSLPLAVSAELAL